MIEDGLSTSQELFFLQALFPYAAHEALLESATSTNTVEDAVRRAHEIINPDPYSVAYLERERNEVRAFDKENKKKNNNNNNNNNNNTNSRQTFGAMRQTLNSRLSFLDDRLMTGISLVHEYDSAVSVFAIDTAIWDEYFITNATILDIVGGRPLVLPVENENSLLISNNNNNNNTTFTPIVRWVPSINEVEEIYRKKEEKQKISNGSNPPIAKIFESTPEECENLRQNRNKTCNLKTSKSDSNLSKTVLTPLEFSILKEKEWEKALNTLEPWSQVFGDNEVCFISKEITTYCKGLVKVMPEIVSRILSVIEKEIKGTVVAPANHGMFIPMFGGIILDLEEIKAIEVKFGRSYAVFEENGEYISFRLKIKKLDLEPISFSYRKLKNKGIKIEKGTIKIKVKNVKVKAKMEILLFTSGRIIIRCKDNHANIGSLSGKCSIMKLHATIAFLKPIIKYKLKQALLEFMSQDITMDQS